MMLLPPKPGTCPICARAHGPEEPHDGASLYYQYRFKGSHGRWPTWADALAHCAPALREAWEAELRRRDAWTAPEDDEPIADPPAESIRQPVGDPNSRDFGPAE
jgi:hypothetical protein